MASVSWLCAAVPSYSPSSSEPQAMRGSGVEMMMAEGGEKDCWFRRDRQRTLVIIYMRAKSEYPIPIR
jgi:hypothetical protein